MQYPIQGTGRQEQWPKCFFHTFSLFSTEIEWGFLDIIFANLATFAQGDVAWAVAGVASSSKAGVLLSPRCRRWLCTTSSCISVTSVHIVTPSYTAHLLYRPGRWAHWPHCTLRSAVVHCLMAPRPHPGANRPRPPLPAPIRKRKVILIWRYRCADASPASGSRAKLRFDLTGRIEFFVIIQWLYGKLEFFSFILPWLVFCTLLCVAWLSTGIFFKGGGTITTLTECEWRKNVGIFVFIIYLPEHI